jgi:YVTN family beta-propeller protein
MWTSHSRAVLFLAIAATLLVVLSSLGAWGSGPARTKNGPGTATKIGPGPLTPSIRHVPVPMLRSGPTMPLVGKARPPGPNSVVATVPVGTFPAFQAIDAANHDIYVVNEATNNVSVISGTTNRVVATVPVGAEPYAVGYDAVNLDIYVMNANSNNVSVIDGATNHVVATIPVGSDPNYLAVDNANDDIYVVNTVSDTVSVIAGATNQLLTTVPVGV